MRVRSRSLTGGPSQSGAGVFQKSLDCSSPGCPPWRRPTQLELLITGRAEPSPHRKEGRGGALLLIGSPALCLQGQDGS